MLFSSPTPGYIALRDKFGAHPPPGTPYSVAIPGTEKPGRSKIYRAFNAQDELLLTLDPKVRKEYPQAFSHFPK